MITLQYSYQKLQKMLNIPIYDIIQSSNTKIRAVKDCNLWVKSIPFTVTVKLPTVALELFI